MAESLGSAVLELDVDDRRISSGMARAERSTTSGFKRMLQQASRTAFGIGAYFATVKLAHIFTSPIRDAANFQTSMKLLEVQTQATGAHLQNMSKRAIKLGADLRLPAVSAGDAADAMLELSKGGFSYDQIMKSIRPTLLLGTAAEISFADAANVVTQTLTAFKMPATEAGHVVDMMAAAAVASVADVSDITAAMTFAAQSFHAAGVGAHDATVAIGVMAQGGQRGSVAGATLGIMMQKLANPTKKAAETMKELGINVWDSHGRFIGIRPAIEQLTPILDKMSEKQRLATLAILGGQRGMRGLNILLGGGTKAWDKMNKAVERAGMAQKLANARTAGFNGAMSGLKSTLETLSITLGTKLLPKATEFTRFLNRVAGAKSFTVAIKIAWTGAVNVAGDLRAAISDALFGHSGHMAIVPHGAITIGEDAVAYDPGLIQKLSDKLAAMDWSSIGSKLGKAISSKLEISENAMQRMLNSMQNWFNAHTGQIAEIGLVIGLKMIAKLLDPSFWAEHWQLIGGIFLSAATVAFPEGRFADIGIRILKWLLKPLERLGSEFAKIALDAVLNLAASLEKNIGPLAGKIALWLGEAIVKVAGLVVKSMVKLGEMLIRGLLNKLASLGKLTRTVLFTGIVTVIGNLAEDVYKAAERLGKRLVNGVLHGIEGIGKDVYNKLKQIVNEVNQIAQDVWAAALRIGRRIVSGVLAGLGNLASAVADKVTSALSSAWDVSGGRLTGSGHFHFTKHVAGIPMMEGVIEGIRSMEGKLSDALFHTVSTAGERGGAAVAKVGSHLKNTFDKIADSIKNSIKHKFDQAVASVDAAYAAAQAKLDKWQAKATPKEALLAALQAQDAANAATKAVTDAEAALNKVRTDYKTAWADLLATQAANIDKMQKQQFATVTDAALAGHEFDKANSTIGANDPLAANLLNARKNLDTTKELYLQGGMALQTLFDAQDAYDQALLAAQDDTDAQTLLQAYDTWQQMLETTKAGQDALDQQRIDDQTAQKQLTDDFHTSENDALVAYWDARHALEEFNIGLEADKERAARDAEYAELSTALKARHDRTLLHIANVEHAWDLHYDHLIQQAKTDGAKVGSAFTDALDEIANPGGRLAQSMTRIANIVKQYLKLNSPAEKGPLSELDTFWTKFVPTLLSGLDQKQLSVFFDGALTPNMQKGVLADPSRGPMGGSSGNGAGRDIQLTQNFHQVPAEADPATIGAVTSRALKTVAT